MFKTYEEDRSFMSIFLLSGDDGGGEARGGMGVLRVSSIGSTMHPHNC